MVAIYMMIIIIFSIESITNCLSDKGWKEITFWIGDVADEPTNSNLLQSFSQVGQDEFVLEILRNKRNGYFVDLAANNASHMSNTVMLERRNNWTGLCIEANPKYLWGLASRKCTVISAAVFSQSNKDIIFNFERRDSPKSGPYASSLGGIVDSETDNKVAIRHSAKYKTVSLAKLFNDFNVPRVIDYFSFDVEGAEWKILSTFPLNRYIFLVLSYERPSVEAHRKLSRSGYWFVRVMSKFGECIYVHRTIDDFKTIMASTSHYRNASSFYISKRNATHLLTPKWLTG